MFPWLGSKPIVDITAPYLLQVIQLTGERGALDKRRSDSRPTSDNAVLAAMRRIGIGKDETSGQGFRAMHAPFWMRCWASGPTTLTS